jgi:6-pyruvoyl-tetrahydropterin synthase
MPITMMNTCVTKTFHFEAAHQLPWHQGKCRNLHEVSA